VSIKLFTFIYLSVNYFCSFGFLFFVSLALIATFQFDRSGERLRKEILLPIEAQKNRRDIRESIACREFRFKFYDGGR